jgi:hypothetical protein
VEIRRDMSTHEMGIRILVTDAMKRKEPNQSTRFNCPEKEDALTWCCLRKKATMIDPAPIIGKLIQKIQRHDTVFY